MNWGETVHKMGKGISPASPMFEVCKDLIREFVNKLVKTQVDLSFYFIIEELLLEFMQSIMSTVIVQIEWIQDVPETKYIIITVIPKAEDFQYNSR